MNQLFICSFVIIIVASCSKPSTVHPFGPLTCDSIYISDGHGILAHVFNVSNDTVLIAIVDLESDNYDQSRLTIQGFTKQKPPEVTNGQLTFTSGYYLPLQTKYGTVKDEVGGKYMLEYAFDISDAYLHKLGEEKLATVNLMGKNWTISEEFSLKFFYYTNCLISKVSKK